MSLAAIVKRHALELGFDLVGIAPLEAWADLEFSRKWVERGYGGEMRYLENPKRNDPRLILPAATSVVCVGLIYNAPLPYSTEVSRRSSEAAGDVRGTTDQERRYHRPVSSSESRLSNGVNRPRAWISRYAWGRDYHELMRARLEQLRSAIEALATDVETRVYVDTGPIVERAFARLSGIGWMGKNTCLINQEKGSWFFLGVILTSLELTPDLPAFDRCGSCTRCLEACPTGALVEPYIMDASRCIAYFNIELKGSIPVEFREAIGANVFGCDICQDVCPWNNRPLPVVGGLLPVPSGQRSAGMRQQDLHHAVGTTALPEFQPLPIDLRNPAGGSRQRTSYEQGSADDRQQTAPARGMEASAASFSLFNPPLEALASLPEDDFRRIFAHSPIKRVKYRGWLRNLCVAMGNSGDPRFIPWLERAGQHEDAVVREHAEWALERLRGQPANWELTSRERRTHEEEK